MTGPLDGDTFDDQLADYDRRDETRAQRFAELERRQPAGEIAGVDHLLTALDAATSPGEVRLIFDRAEALYEAAKRARVSDDQLREYAAVSLRAQRRGGELLKATPRSKGRPWHGLPTISAVLDLPANKAKHVAENWIAVAEVPPHLFDDYLARPEQLPTRAGLLRFRQHRPRRPPGRPPANPTRLRSVPDAPAEPPTTRREQPHPAHGLPLPDPLDVARAQGWQACVEWFAKSGRVPMGLIVDAETANPYDDDYRLTEAELAAHMATRRPPGTPG